MDISIVKELNNASTTEDLFGFNQPPEYQCPKLDDIKNVINEVEKLSMPKDYSDTDDLKDRLQQIEYAVYGLDSTIEEVREAIELIREWGKEWKGIVKDHMIADSFLFEDYGIVTESYETINRALHKGKIR